MKLLPLFQVDAFTSRLFGGNPAAVCVLDPVSPGSKSSWSISSSLMQRVAEENNLAETAFCAKDERSVGADGLSLPRYLLRWFTPEIEMDLCGHATLASAHVLLTEKEKQAQGIR